VTARIAAAACARLPELDDDWVLLRAALSQRGVAATAEVWNNPAVDWASYDLVVVRGTWDYFGRLDEFLAWIDQVGTASRLVNPAPVLRWNTDKRYLTDLAAASVPIVPTAWVLPGAAWSPPEGEFVVKPSVSAGGFETARYRPGEVGSARRHVERLHEAGYVAMVQPYVPSVDRDGESALIYLGGRFSHAINKAALLKAGRGVVDELWSDQRITPSEPSAAERRIAEAALAAVQEVTGAAVSYARVDLLPDPELGPAVIELELIEPALFLDRAAGAADRFAEVLAALL
jgi:glutathione synthase/RimK-type ligase-like ATP-grasp enzyme